MQPRYPEGEWDETEREGEVKFGRVKGKISGIRAGEKEKQGVRFLMNDEMWMWRNVRKWEIVFLNAYDPYILVCVWKKGGHFGRYWEAV